jgi:hypothetical protein
MREKVLLIPQMGFRDGEYRFVEEPIVMLWKTRVMK